MKGLNTAQGQRLLGECVAEFSRGSSVAAQRTARLLGTIDLPVTNDAPVPTSTGQTIWDHEMGISPPEYIAHMTVVQSRSPCLSIVQEIYRGLDWYQSAKSNSPYTQIVGPSCRIAREDFRLGLLLLPENIVYPNHQHSPDEVYIVLAGSGEWSLNRGTFDNKTAGNIIDIPSMTIHAMRTSTTPALMLWSWTGDDISSDSYRFC
jgi:mannose-6-phosphate isomerase-like protein (cupin superfamily)